MVTSGILFLGQIGYSTAMYTMTATRPQSTPVSYWCANAGIGCTVTLVEKGEQWDFRLARLLFRVLLA